MVWNDVRVCVHVLSDFENFKRLNFSNYLADWIKIWYGGEAEVSLQSFQYNFRWK